MDYQKFHFFSSLPTEVRLKIFELNLPGPRLVLLNYTSIPASTPNNPARGCTSPAKIPTNLHVNKEARLHAQKRYTLSFPLPYRVPKTWYDFNNDVLYFPSREGWLGPWNHFASAISMIKSEHLGRVKRLAVSEALFKGVRGTRSSENVQATCTREFWDYVRKKFTGVEEVAVVCDGVSVSNSKDEELRAWMEGVLGCVLGKDGVWIGTEKERLVEGLENAVKVVEEANKWVAPRWDVVSLPDGQDGSGAEDWLAEALGEKSRRLSQKVVKREGLDSIMIPRSRAPVKREPGFWMGGQLSRWHYLAEA